MANGGELETVIVVAAVAAAGWWIYSTYFAVPNTPAVSSGTVGGGVPNGTPAQSLGTTGFCDKLGNCNYPTNGQVIAANAAINAGWVPPNQMTSAQVQAANAALVSLGLPALPGSSSPAGIAAAAAATSANSACLSPAAMAALPVIPGGYTSCGTPIIPQTGVAGYRGLGTNVARRMA